jgi:voltage-gated potassium channel
MKNLKIKLSEEEIYSIIGLGGISQYETYRARCWGRLFMFLMIVAAAILLLQWQWALLGKLTFEYQLLINWLVWLIFIFVFTTELVVVKAKRRYLAQNWLLPVIIILGMFFLLGKTHYIHILDSLRPILALIILVPSFGTLFKFLFDGQLRTTLIAAFVIVVITGLLISGIDPNIRTPWDGIWWALATVSTVGYGDVVPTSALGRLLGAGLVVTGIALFVIITANILALILRKGSLEKQKTQHEQMDKLTKDMELCLQNQSSLMELGKTLSKRLGELEKSK